MNKGLYETMNTLPTVVLTVRSNGVVDLTRKDKGIRVVIIDEQSNRVVKAYANDVFTSRSFGKDQWERFQIETIRKARKSRAKGGNRKSGVRCDGVAAVELGITFSEI